MSDLLQRIVGWLRDGYPRGVPDQDYIPLLALLRRRLSPEEITSLGAQLVAAGTIPADRVDVASRYLLLTNELPSEEELARVAATLREAGWEIEDDPPAR